MSTISRAGVEILLCVVTAGYQSPGMVEGAGEAMAGMQIAAETVTD